MKTYLYLLAYGRSGSTLMDWLLDSHPNILGLGEIGRLPDCLGPGGRPPRFCACGTPLQECGFWAPVLEAGGEGRGMAMPWEDWNRLLLAHTARNKPTATVLLDSSGHLPRLRRLMTSGLAQEYDVRVLYMSRDARGVVYSAHVRGYNKGEFKPSLPRASAGWWLRNTQALGYIRKLPRDRSLHVTYEDLCDDADGLLRRIQSFVGVSPLGLAEDWRSQVHHTFAGNVSLRESKTADIRADMKWTRAMAPWEQCVVEMVTGRLNRKLLNGKALA